jgi:tRNA (guanine37-N1)-methyltransferase
MKFTVLTIFPEFFPGPLGFSLAGKTHNKLWELNIINIREFAHDIHRTVDDKPCGGGNGMIMKADILGEAIESVISKTKFDRLLYPSPRGKLLTQNKVIEVAKAENLLFLCGRFEGVDQRVIDYFGFEEISIGDYVLSGGELATCVMIDSILRHIPGIIKNNNVHEDESFHQVAGIKGILEYPQYTKPQIWKNIPVPEILFSGNHAKINQYRAKAALEYTQKNRPDLIANSAFTAKKKKT